jgi:AcrR family transcriptional regulator
MAQRKSSEDIRNRILDAADARYRTYGYNKTTMAEIAEDCNMSAANLYRHFKNKLDIGAHLANRCLSEESTLLLDIIGEKSQSATQRLEGFVLGILHFTFDNWSKSPKINELVTAVCHERKDILEQHIRRKQTILISLLNEGHQNGEFKISDPAITAEAILSSTVLFDSPILMHLFTLEDFERKANNVVQLLLNGILKR